MLSWVRITIPNRTVLRIPTHTGQELRWFWHEKLPTEGEKRGKQDGGGGNEGRQGATRAVRSSEGGELFTFIFLKTNVNSEADDGFASFT